MIDMVYDCLDAVGAVQKRRTRTPLSLIKMNTTPLPGGSLVSLLFVDHAVSAALCCARFPAIRAKMSGFGQTTTPCLPCKKPPNCAALCPRRFLRAVSKAR